MVIPLRSKSMIARLNTVDKAGHAALVGFDAKAHLTGEVLKNLLRRLW
jgi:hypothetical protein